MEELASFETDSVTGYSHASVDGKEGVEMVPVDMEFNVTVPRDLGGRCAKAGNCVSSAELGEE